MEERRTFESFPISIVALTNAITLSTYALGAYVLAGFGVVAAVLYALYCFGVELMVLTRSCVNCAYYGKRCGLGRGRLCSTLFEKGDARKFTEREVSWVDMLPDFLVVILPIVGGVVLSIRDFSWLRVAALALLIVLSLAGNAVSRGLLACRYCKQREIGCPAASMFGVDSSD